MTVQGCDRRVIPTLPGVLEFRWRVEVVVDCIAGDVGEAASDQES